MHQGMFSSDIGQRFKNKQILMNGDPTQNIELDVECDKMGFAVVQAAGDFVFHQIKDNEIMKLKMEILGLPFVMDTEFPNHKLLKLSKREMIVVKLNNQVMRSKPIYKCRISDRIFILYKLSNYARNPIDTIDCCIAYDK